MTVRRAISELLHEGVIYAIPGKGLYVTEPKQDAEPPLRGFTEDMSQRGMVASSQVLAAEIVGASTVLSSALGVPIGTALVYLRRLRLADGAPMAVQGSYLPQALCPGLLEHDLGRGSLFELLRNVYHLRLADGTTAVEAALADAEHARLLGLRAARAAADCRAAELPRQRPGDRVRAVGVSGGSLPTAIVVFGCQRV